jgi:phosphomannomutase
MTKIKFGTDGWRGVIADDYTVENLMRVAEATGKWMKQRSFSKVVIGFDTRFGSKFFAQETARVFAAQGHTVLFADEFVCSPMVSYGVVKNKADLGVVITASHNSAAYNGYKLKSNIGGPFLSLDITAVENLIPDKCSLQPQSYSYYENSGQVEKVDLEEQYLQYIKDNIDLDAIYKSNFRIVYDGMYGTGQRIFPRLFPDLLLLNCNYNPSYMNQTPDPIKKNLILMSQLTAGTPYTHCGIANDGDADRIAMCDENGVFINSHQIILLLLYYLVKYKNLKGKVIISFSVSNKVQQLAKHFGVDIQLTKVGFKHIAEIMASEDVLLGGEESGGIGIKGHIPDKDGVWSGLTLLEFMAKSGRPLSKLLLEIEQIVGSFYNDRIDMDINQALLDRIIEQAESNIITQIDGRPIVKSENLDGYKYYLSNEEWIMIRHTGTEKVLRIYGQGPTSESVNSLLESTVEMLKNM